MTASQRQQLRELLDTLQKECVSYCEQNAQKAKSECLARLISRVSSNIGFLEAFLDMLERPPGTDNK